MVKHTSENCNGTSILIIHAPSFGVGGFAAASPPVGDEAGGVMVLPVGSLSAPVGGYGSADACKKKLVLSNIFLLESKAKGESRGAHLSIIVRVLGL